MAVTKVGVLLAAVAFVLGCSPKQDAPGLQERLLALLEAKADTGVELRAVLLGDTVTVEDRTAVDLVFAVVNGPFRTPFSNDPGRFQIVVTGPDGQPARSLGGAGPVLRTLGRQTEMVLPAGGVLVQRQDLRCVNDAGYSSIPFPPIRDNCLARYALDTPGSYRVTVEYFGPEPDSVLAALERRDPRYFAMLQAAPGVHLADTVMLVVVGG